MSTQDLVAKLWNFCNLLRDDCVTYHECISKLTFIVFLKMAKETGIEDTRTEKEKNRKLKKNEKRKEANIPEECRWDDLEAHNAASRLDEYKKYQFTWAPVAQPLPRPFTTMPVRSCANPPSPVKMTG